eukprot:283792-Pelagomonas_calceolata.AAC.4
MRLLAVIMLTMMPKLNDCVLAPARYYADYYVAAELSDFMPAPACALSQSLILACAPFVACACTTVRGVLTKLPQIDGPG